MPAYTIETGSRGCYLDVTCSGMWSLQKAHSYRMDLRAETLRLMPSGVYRGALVRFEGYDMQSRDVVDVHEAAMLLARETYGVRAAALIGRWSAQIQVGLTAMRTGHRVFFREEEALDWLMGWTAGSPPPKVRQITGTMDGHRDSDIRLVSVEARHTGRRLA